MAKKRLFIAINLPEKIKNKLFDYQRKWGNLPVRWTPKINLHITLVFIGYVSDDEMYEICNLVKGVAKRHDAFNINFKKIILGPPDKPPRMFWVEGEKSEELAKLRDDLEGSLFNSSVSGFKNKEVRAYRPHITLGRIQHERWKELNPCPTVDEIFERAFLVETIDVMESELKRTGAEYTILESVRLGE